MTQTPNYEMDTKTTAELRKLEAQIGICPEGEPHCWCNGTLTG
jgi:hypothetical protein